jgi:hypothetical protein
MDLYVDIPYPANVYGLGNGCQSPETPCAALYIFQAHEDFQFLFDDFVVARDAVGATCTFFLLAYL